MTEYSPDSWVVIRMSHKDATLYKVLGGWSGGYTQGDSWRLNSGVDRVEVDGDRYLFHGSSGSVYSCHRDGYGLRMSTIGIWDQMKALYPDNVELLPDGDWAAFDFGNQTEAGDAQDQGIQGQQGPHHPR